METDTHKQMAGTRVLLEFGDGKKYWNLIDPTLGETIQDVICSIELKFSVKCEELLLEDAVLPPKESIRIFRDKDLIRYVILMTYFLTSLLIRYFKKNNFLFQFQGR